MAGKWKKTKTILLPGDRAASVSPEKVKQVERFKEYGRKRAKKKGITLPEEEDKEKSGLKSS